MSIAFQGVTVNTGDSPPIDISLYQGIIAVRLSLFTPLNEAKNGEEKDKAGPPEQAVSELRCYSTRQEGPVPIVRPSVYAQGENGPRGGQERQGGKVGRR